jgi:hypothetical protein
MLDFDVLAEPASRRARGVKIGRHEVDVTPVFDAYWRFAAERQRIFFRRLDGVAGALTNDPILQGFKFTNAYRASDRVSQYLIKNVIYRCDLPNDETNVFFRVLLFKFFNKIETWTTLEKEIGPITWEAFSFKRFDAVLSREMARGNTPLGAASSVISRSIRTTSVCWNMSFESAFRRVCGTLHQWQTPSRC